MPHRPTAPPLDHGLVGNGRVLGLVAPDTGVEWLCLPRFDAPSLFGRLLDAEQGGVFRVEPAAGPRAGALSYLPNTNVLSTRFTEGDAVWEVVDFAPRLPARFDPECPPAFHRLVLPLTGNPRLRMRFDPRPDYARAPPRFTATGHGLVIDGGPSPVTLFTNLPHDVLLAGRDFTLQRPLFFALHAGTPRDPVTLADVLAARDLTVEGWRAWTKTCALPGFADPLVLRSSLVLKAHVYEETGAIIAATTTSIPEAMGTQRTWDYRYCWLRDSVFVVEALRRLSHLREGERFLRFLRDVADSGPLQPIYAIDGGRELPEEFLPHLAGFGGNGYVRIGNAAADQRQHDVMGELMLCLDTLLHDPRLVFDEPRAHWPLVRRLVEEAIAAGPVPDTGIWEFRTLLRPYTFSRAMCWAAIDRGASFAAANGEPTLAAAWRKKADDEREEILRRAYNPRVGHFTQALDGEWPDASNLLLPLLGLVRAEDPRFLGTLDATRDRLCRNGLVRRYVNTDDFGQTESAFSICTFWYAEALALAGRLDEAVEVFQRVAKHANPLGLFSEDIDPETGSLMGNFPQAYTHVGLVNAATTIGHALAARDRTEHAWS